MGGLDYIISSDVSAFRNRVSEWRERNIPTPLLINRTNIEIQKTLVPNNKSKS